MMSSDKGIFVRILATCSSVASLVFRSTWVNRLDIRNLKIRNFHILWIECVTEHNTTLFSSVNESSWNLMAHGDAREGKWRGNWRIEWVASTHTLPRHMVYPALLPLMRTLRLPAVDWTNAPRQFKWTRPSRRKTKCDFCACAIRFRTSSVTE